MSLVPVVLLIVLLWLYSFHRLYRCTMLKYII